MARGAAGPQSLRSARDAEPFDAASFQRLYRSSTESKAMSPLRNLAVRDLETLVHPYTNLAALRETGPLILERGQGIYRGHGGTLVHRTRLRQRRVGRGGGDADAQASL